MHLPKTPAIEALSRRILWFEPPEVALTNTNRFIAYAMRYGTHHDMELIRRYVDDNQLRDALKAAPPGVIDPRSWAYWHVKLGIFPPPEMPVRQL